MLKEDHKSIFTTLEIVDIKELAEGFKLITFQPEKPFSYQAGQYLTLIWDNMGQEMRRSYSFASSPDLGEPMSIGVKRVENGLLSRWLNDNIFIGHKMLTSGAAGRFVLPAYDTHDTSFFFFAAGSGIIPVYSLLKTLMAIKSFLSVTLVYSSHAPETTIFREQLQQLMAEHPGKFHVEFIFGNNSKLEKAHLHRNLLLELVRQYSAGDQSQQLFYLCGPEAYMRMCMYTLQAAGYHHDQIKRENFFVNKLPAHAPIPPDQQDRMVTIELHGEKKQFKVLFPETILQAARRQGIILPYSCEAGSCSSCMALCTSGKVWMSYNEVLTDKEVEKGWILTCTGHPDHADILLEYRKDVVST